MALSYANVKTFKAIRGIREALVDITLDGDYVNGGWEILPAALTSYSAIANVIYDVNPPTIRGGYEFEWDQVAGKLKAHVPGVVDTFVGEAMAEFTAYPAFTATAQAAAFMKVYSVAELSFAPCATSNAVLGDTYAADFQLFPDADADAIGDAVYFGDEVPFAQIGIDVSTGMTWSGTPVLWEYYNDDGTWDTLAIVNDGSSSTGATGITSFEQDGVITFVPPVDWGSSTIDSQAAYWVRAKLGAAGVTTPGVMADEWDINVPDTGYVPTRDGLITGLAVNDTSDTAHTGADIHIVIWNSVTGDSSGEIVFPQDVVGGILPLPVPVPVSIGNKLAFICTQEDGTNEFDSGAWGLAYGTSEALASDPALKGLVLRCHVVGS